MIRIRARQKLGKYRVEKRLAQGGFADVFRAYDTVEGVSVALKVPNAELVTNKVMEDFRREARLVARLDHPNILSIKTADVIGGVFTIVYPLGDRSLDDRIRSRMSLRTAMRYAEQLLQGLACAHSHSIIHCDLKPENLILFGPERLRLADFGIAKVAQKTLPAGSGAGTVGYMAPEQAMGKPSFRSDVFSAGLILYRLFTGVLPEWPFTWPPPGYDRVRRKLHPKLIELLRRCIEIDHRKRYADGEQLLQAFLKVRPKALGYFTAQARRRNGKKSTTSDWKSIRLRQFKRQFGKVLEARHECPRCAGPVSEAMRACPWCGHGLEVFRGTSAFPRVCGRCNRGMKLDWRYCAHCFGAGYEATDRRFSDRRYSARCANPGCSHKELMPWMRYCPWCRTKVRRPWTILGVRERCSRCGWGVLSSYWYYCPWCHKALPRGS